MVELLACSSFANDQVPRSYGLSPFALTEFAGSAHRLHGDDGAVCDPVRGSLSGLDTMKSKVWCRRNYWHRNPTVPGGRYRATSPSVPAGPKLFMCRVFSNCPTGTETWDGHGITHPAGVKVSVNG